LSKVIEYTKGILGSEDEFKTSFRGTLGRSFGYIILCNQRLLFIHEKGAGGEFDKILEVPYDSVQAYGFPEPNILSITQKDGNTNQIEVAGSTLFLKMSLKDLIKT
jgi:hypothetical protein